MNAENKNFPNDGITYNNLAQGAWAREEGYVKGWAHTRMMQN